MRRARKASDRKPKLKKIETKLKLTRLQMFEILFPVDYMKHIMLPKMNVKLSAAPISYGELLQFLSIWLHISTTVGFKRREFWSIGNKKYRDTPMKFNTIMSRNRFENILTSPTFTADVSPPFKDKFWEVRSVIEAWNLNMEENVSPGHIPCLDESMFKWLSKCTCPGFMVVPRKPWAFENEYHTICCSQSGVLFAMELREGKDRPEYLPPKAHSDLGKTMGLVLRICRSLEHTGSIVFMDSVFCVVKAIIELRKRGIFSSSMIKKSGSGLSM